MKDSNAVSIPLPKSKEIKEPGPVNKLGRTSIYDRTAGRIISLPDGWLIYHFNHRAWMGGSVDGKAYLHIERQNPEDPLPGIWAEADLGLYVCTVAPPSVMSQGVNYAKVAGSFSNKNIQGVLAKVQITPRHVYLVLIAAEEDSVFTDLKTSMQLIARSLMAE